MSLDPTVIGIMTNDIKALVEQLKAPQVQKTRLLDEERQIVDRLAQAARTGQVYAGKEQTSAYKSYAEERHSELTKLYQVQ